MKYHERFIKLKYNYIIQYYSHDEYHITIGMNILGKNIIIYLLLNNCSSLLVSLPKDFTEMIHYRQ